jgi:Ca2+-binding RTX toxin-like protein
VPLRSRAALAPHRPGRGWGTFPMGADTARPTWFASMHVASRGVGRPARFLTALVCVVATAAVGVAADAQASTFSRDYVDGSYALRYTAAAGEANQLTLSSSATVTTAVDPGASVAAGTACAQVDAHTVTCPRRDPSVPMPDFPIIEIDVSLGDGNDSGVVTASCEAMPFGGRCRHLDGGSGDDHLTGGADSDVFVGRDGDGDDTYAGGGGDDLADYSAATTAVHVTLDAVADDGPSGQQDLVPAELAVLGGSGDDTLVGSAGPDDLDGGPGTDALTGGAGDDHLRAYLGSDSLSGGPGDDRLVAEYTQAAVLHGGDDNDTVTATLNAGTASVDGEGGDDTITAGGLVHGGDGNDVLHAYGTGTLDGGPGDDVLDDHDSAGIAQRLDGGPGFDTVEWTGAHNEGISASNDGVANDGGPPGCGGCAAEGDNVGTDVERLVGSYRDDTLTGGPGDDVLVGGVGQDVLQGGPGKDTVEYSTSPGGVTVTLDGAANDGGGLDGYADDVRPDIEHVIGSPFADTLIGSAGPDLLDGGAGDDVLDGGAGDDTLNGGQDNDELTGGAGRDTLSAGAGDDFIDSSEDPTLADALIDCGPGQDAVFADNLVDVLEPNCEVVAPELSGDPTLTGQPIEGETLTARVPSYTGGPASTTTEWLACDTAGQDCDVIATGATYVLTADDVGFTIRVLYRAENDAGLDERVSQPTAVVAASARPAATPTQPPPPAPGRVLPQPSARPNVAAPGRLTMSIAAVRCAGRRCTIRLHLGGDVARVKAELRKGKRRLTSATKAAKPGTLAVTLKITHRLKTGRYVLRLTLTAKDGRTRRLETTVRVP